MIEIQTIERRSLLNDLRRNEPLEAVGKLNPAKLEDALAAAENNDLNDIFFRIGEDVYVGSTTRHRANFEELDQGDTVFYQGKRGTVVSTNQEIRDTIFNWFRKHNGKFDVLKRFFA